MSSEEAGKTKAEIIEIRKANLPLPDQPPVPSDWNSASESINSGSGARQDDTTLAGDASGLREPASVDSAVRTDGETFHTGTAGLEGGREAKDNLGGIPSDAVAKEARGKPGVVDTMNKDYGYPEKNDPSSGL